MSRRADPPYPPILSPDEWDVLALVADGYTDDDISSRLGVSAPRVGFQLREILGKLRLSSREEAAAWYRERFPRAPLFASLVERLRTSPNASRLLGGGVVGLVAIAVGIAAWGLAHPSRPPGPVPVPVVVRAPDFLQGASWANDAKWIVRYDVRPAGPDPPANTLALVFVSTIMDREFHDVKLALPDGADVVYASLTDTRVVTRGSDTHTFTVRDGVTGDVSAEVIRAWDLPNFRYVLLDGSYRDEIGLPDGTSGAEPWAERTITVDGSTVTVWEVAKVREVAGIPRARTDVTIAQDGSIGLKDQHGSDPFDGFNATRSSDDEPVPRASLVANSCGIWRSPSGRFAVVSSYVSSLLGPLEGPSCGPCHLVDVSRNTVGDEWDVSPSDQILGGSCDAVSWSPDEREILLSGFDGG